MQSGTGDGDHADRPSGDDDDAEPGQVAVRFRAAWSGNDDPATASGELLPARLARAGAAVLEVDGAGLSLIDQDFRVPLGASDAAAAHAERLQFTQGEGPCLSAARNRRTYLAGPDELGQRWPLFTEQLFAQTPYRAVVSLPVEVRPGVTGALDLLIVDPRRLDRLRLADVLTVGHDIGEVLRLAEDITGDRATAWGDAPGPRWLHSPAAQDRRNAWIAAGIIIAALDLTAQDAIALLRARAYAENSTLDEIAADVVTHRLDADQLRP